MRKIIPIVLLFVSVLAIADSAPAQDPESFEARAEYLLRRMDSGLLPTPMLVSMLKDPYSETRILAVRVVASSGDPSQSALLPEYFRDRDFRVRYEVMVAAGRLGADGRELALAGLRDEVPMVRQAAAWAACHGGVEALGPLMAVMEQEPDLGVRTTAVANLWRFGEADWETHAASAARSGDAQLRRAAAYSLARSGSTRARAALRSLAADAEPVIRATAIAGLRRAALAKDDLAIVMTALNDGDARVRTAACWVLAEQPEPALPEASAAAVAAMWAPTEPQLAAMALRAAAARREIGSDAGLLEIVGSDEPWLRAEAFSALARRAGDGLGEVAKEWFSSEEPWRRRAVAAAAPMLGEAWEKRVAAADEAAVRLAWLESLGPDAVAARVEVLRRLVAGDPDPIVRTVALNHLGDAGAGGSFDSLLELARSWVSDEMPDARAAALTAALAAAESEDERILVMRRAVDDRNPAVTILVINAARSAGLPARSAERELRHDQPWYLELVEWMREDHWLDVATDRGTFRIRLETTDAPITAREIFDLAEAGFYDGLTFHRVAPNFVVQGGDPRGDGWGGPGFIVPDEPAFRPFDSWRVGVATSGPNTGGSQFFVTLMPADHLVGHYTNLGDVTAGREVLPRLRVGDRIRGIEGFSGDEPPLPEPFLLGPVDWDELAQLSGWQEEYDAGEPDPAALERLGSATGSYRIVSVLGSWCHDSRREIPRLVKVLDQLSTPVFSHEMIGVDRTRRIDDPEVASFAGIERTVDLVATIAVFDDAGVELGRVVETAEKPIEELLIEFIAPVEGW